jgi:hypothetical protein
MVDENKNKRGCSPRRWVPWRAGRDLGWIVGAAAIVGFLVVVSGSRLGSDQFGLQHTSWRGLGARDDRAVGARVRLPSYATPWPRTASWTVGHVDSLTGFPNRRFLGEPSRR